MGITDGDAVGSLEGNKEIDGMGVEDGLGDDENDAILGSTE